jgi:uncharacterized phage protein (TIGR01671 family)
MRELKFRAWVSKENTDGYGKNTAHYEYNFALFESKYTDFCGDFEIGGTYEDVPVEQYTGLKDKNGKEIYEGDIVNISAIACTDDSPMACIIDTNSVVVWDEKHARFDVNDAPEDDDLDYRRRRYFLFTDGDDRENIEVIGNIHENPELLGGEE